MTGRARRRVGVLSLAGIAGLALVLLDNNVSWQPSSRASFAARLDRAVDLGKAWLVDHPEDSNSALLYMISDVATLTGDLRLRRIVDRGLQGPFQTGVSFWRRMVDPHAQVRPPRRADLDAIQSYQRWLAYAVAPELVQLTPAERADMFDPEKFRWGSRTHQLFSLVLCRERSGRSAELDRVIDHLSAGIAFEAHWDVRVTDLYLQRVAFLLHAGHPELVRRRWVERILGKQEADGGWTEPWHHWGPPLFRFTMSAPAATTHATSQGVWLLCALRYRYPSWIERNYR